MYFDRQLTPSTGQSVALAVGTYYSTDVIDLATQGRDISRANELRWWVGVAAAITSGGAGTLVVNVVEADTADLLTNTTVVHTSGAPKAPAALVAGTVLIDTAAGGTRRRYMGLQFIVAGATLTGGAITGGLLKNTQSGVALGERPQGNTGL